MAPARYSRVAITALLNGVAGLWGRQRVERKPELKGRGLATAGIWLGVLGLVVGTVATVASGGWEWTAF